MIKVARKLIFTVTILGICSSTASTASKEDYYLLAEIHRGYSIAEDTDEQVRQLLKNEWAYYLYKSGHDNSALNIFKELIKECRYDDLNCFYWPAIFLDKLGHAEWSKNIANMAMKTPNAYGTSYYESLILERALSGKIKDFYQETSELAMRFDNNTTMVPVDNVYSVVLAKNDYLRERQFLSWRRALSELADAENNSILLLLSVATLNAFGNTNICNDDCKGDLIARIILADNTYRSDIINKLIQSKSIDKAFNMSYAKKLVYKGDLDSAFRLVSEDNRSRINNMDIYIGVLRLIEKNKVDLALNAAIKYRSLFPPEEYISIVTKSAIKLADDNSSTRATQLLQNAIPLSSQDVDVNKKQLSWRSIVELAMAWGRIGYPDNGISLIRQYCHLFDGNSNKSIPDTVEVFSNLVMAQEGIFIAKNNNIDGGRKKFVELFRWDKDYYIASKFVQHSVFDYIETGDLKGSMQVIKMIPSTIDRQWILQEAVRRYENKKP